MILAIVVISLDNQVHVKVLHTLMQLNAVARNSNMQCNIHFCDNDPTEKARVFKDITNGPADKMVWLEVDMHIDFMSIVDILNTHSKEDLIAFSSIENRVDWDQFKSYTEKDIEPLTMRALHTDLSISKTQYNPDLKLINIQRSDLRAFVLSTKKFVQKTKKKFKNTNYYFIPKEINGTLLSAPHNLCRMAQEAGIRLKAYVDTDVCRYFKHEHIGCIMNTHGTSIEVKK